MKNNVNPPWALNKIYKASPIEKIKVTGIIKGS
jgi:hypothetical protein